MKSRVLATLIATAALAMSVTAFAEDKHAAGDGHGHAEGHEHGAEKAHFEKKTFGTVKEAWGFITAQVPEVEKHVAAKAVEPVHEIGEHLGSAVHALEEKSDMVAADQKTKLAAVLKQLEKAADELHHAGEEKSADAAGLALKKMKGLLAAVEGLYPAGALK
ncbi:MAG: hypothetical protein AB7U75_05645 [Hyphomicrobiaceae bacterium]|nr:hypothetical protein [Hyphomicrobiaceae bacterium]